jgi:capsular polysaccharide biosynthesis protein
MDLLTALKILIRHWLVVLIGLALTTLAVWQVGSRIGPTYEAKGSVLLLGPGVDNNPYLEFGTNLEVMSDALVTVFESPSAVDEVAAAGGTGEYELERAEGPPIIDITATDSSREGATRTAQVVADGMQLELANDQATAPSPPRITLDVLTEPNATAKYGSRIRAQAAVGAVGLVATVAIAFAVDALGRQRRMRKARKWTGAEAPAHSSVQPDPTPDPDAAGANGDHRAAPDPVGATEGADERAGDDLAAATGAHSGRR